ncbi:DUF962 domain-containing protein [Permianibacter aggregans]|uniref:Putative membrane protein YGL010W n=1 Tax=Permianibacter aggregans TaxID=1510150 RepID=A0A4R6UU31_9GAMM|nr:Mpo1-like protein [Permianibacter aggregans]QGX38882.1 DUF962 domain-containing protein [Permianibacter aggregans]TDQ50691.1 putative membrane protein YGL010W [Permianibacter aggregans]
MKTAGQWLDEYGASHQNPTNKLIHWFCVPVIYFTVAAFLYAIPMPFAEKSLFINWSAFVMVLVAIYYLRLNLALGVLMAAFSFGCLWLSHWLDLHAAFPLWQIAAALFVLAWIAQFIGHHIEGKKPSFLKDLQFLMIGPAWVFGFLLRKVGVSL